jgi:hypothetical protein
MVESSALLTLPWTETLLAVGVGIALAAATGLRIFLPLLGLSAAAHWGWLPLAEGFSWLASMPALIALSVAAVVEVAAYYVPGLDHLLDALAGPAAIAAGVVAAAAVMVDLPPWVQWPVALIAGGGSAGLMHGATAVLRAKTGVATGGLGNPAVATGELGGAAALTGLALVLPLAALLLTILALWGAWRLARRVWPRRARRDGNRKGDIHA